MGGASISAFPFVPSVVEARNATAASVCTSLDFARDEREFQK